MNFFSDIFHTEKKENINNQRSYSSDTITPRLYEKEKHSFVKRTIGKMKSVFLNLYKPRARSVNYDSRAFANSSVSVSYSNPEKRENLSQIRNSLMEIQSEERDFTDYMFCKTDNRSNPKSSLIDSQNQTKAKSHEMNIEYKYSNRKFKPDTIIPISHSKKKAQRIIYHSQRIGEVEFVSENQKLKHYPVYNDRQTIEIPGRFITFNSSNFDEDTKTEDEIRIHLIAKGYLNLKSSLQELKSNESRKI